MVPIWKKTKKVGEKREKESMLGMKRQLCVSM